ncbi:MAG: PAS domain S-box protein, partial [Candidatus Neomarinimicrobiota bacterium]
HRWNSRSEKPIIEEIQSAPVTRYWWWVEQVLDKKPIYISDVANLPEECESEKKEFIARGLQSILIVPMVFKNEVIGCLGFYVVEKMRIWSPAEISAIQTVADIIARAVIMKKSEKKLRESEQRYRLLVDKINDAIVINQNGRFVFFNRLFCEMLGYDFNELYLKDYRDVYTPRGIELLKQREAQRKSGADVSPRYETTFMKKDKTVINVEINVTITDYEGAPASLGIIRDVTERKKLEKEFQEMEVQYLKRQRLSSYELMTDGVVHDIKNTLAVISGRAQLLNDRQPELKEPEIIIRHVKQIEKMISAFTKKIKMEKDMTRKPLNLNELIKTEITFFESNTFFKNEVVKRLQFQQEIPTVVGYYGDFSHGIMNIVQFSTLSMAESPEKILTIKTTSVPGGVEIEISDTGKEIPAEIIPTLFTPLGLSRIFSEADKPESRILFAMNLYNSYMILKPYGVTIDVKSQPCVGTTFRLTVPV